MLDKKWFLEYTKNKIREFFEKNNQELSIFKALKVYELLTKQFNELFELIEDWFALQNYMLFKEIKDPYKFLKSIEEKIDEVALGAPLDEESKKHIKELAKVALQLYREKSKLEDFIKKSAKERYKNLSAVLGPMLAVKMLEFTKSLESFAELPASTIQLIGAEKALFRHLKYGKKPPKYGFLYQHSLMAGLKPKQKGKLARFLANKAALAARLDLAGKDRSKELVIEIEEKLKEIKGEKNG